MNCFSFYGRIPAIWILREKFVKVLIESKK